MAQARQQSRLPLQSLSQYLGWLSLGVGALELLAPAWVSRRAGFARTNNRAVQLSGLRQVATGVAILRNPTSPNPIWARVAGDAITLSILANGFSERDADKAMLSTSSLLVAGLTAVDIGCAVGMYDGLGMEHRAPHRIRETITINKSAEDLFRFWRSLNNLPSIMEYLQSVDVRDDKRSHWVAKPIRGVVLEWESEVTAEEPNRLIAWRSLPESQIQTEGSVRFEPLSGDRGTLVTVDMQFDVPSRFGRLFRPLASRLTEAATRRDLRRFKQLMETGEISTTAGQSSGRRTGDTWLDRAAH